MDGVIVSSGKKKSKRTVSERDADDDGPTTAGAKSKYERVLVLGTRGIGHRYRHLMRDIINLLPHSKKESKMDNKDHNYVINEVAEMRSCSSALFFECRKKKDLYLWVSKTPAGPSAKFLVHNVHTLNELKMTGNSLKGSRPLLVFDAAFDAAPHLSLIKDMFTEVFGTPKGHPGSKPFFDHVFSFMIADNKIWFRNYQIADAPGSVTDQQLVEIGPRFVMDLVRIFAGSFSGSTIYQNTEYVSPNALRKEEALERAGKYASRIASMQKATKRRNTRVIPVNEVDTIYGSDFEVDSDIADVDSDAS